MFFSIKHNSIIYGLSLQSIKLD